ncbi:hypothetical protein THAOC_13333, partial [Thalassiosira oceanica]
LLATGPHIGCNAGVRDKQTNKQTNKRTIKCWGSGADRGAEGSTAATARPSAEHRTIAPFLEFVGADEVEAVHLGSGAGQNRGMAGWHACP